MPEKKLLAILGSPHPNGITAQMLHCAVTSAQQAGWHVDTVWLYEKNIAWCQGCKACVPSGICVLEDDLAKIRELLQRCDAVVVAAPTYFANVPGIVKNLFDRLVGCIMDDRTAIPKPQLSSRQKYLLLTSCNTPFPFSWLAGQSRGCLRAMKEVFHISGMTSMGRIAFPGARNKTQLPRSMERKIRRCWH